MPPWLPLCFFGLALVALALQAHGFRGRLDRLGERLDDHLYDHRDDANVCHGDLAKRIDRLAERLDDIIALCGLLANRVDDLEHADSARRAADRLTDLERARRSRDLDAAGRDPRARLGSFHHDEPND